MPIRPESQIEMTLRHFTGDNDLLRLGSYGDIRILRVAEFLKLLPL